MKCNCEVVYRSNQRCGAIADTDDCVVCHACNLHFHIPKGSRKVENDKRDPWKKEV